MGIIFKQIFLTLRWDNDRYFLDKEPSKFLVGVTVCRYVYGEYGALKSDNDFENLTVGKLGGKLTFK